MVTETTAQFWESVYKQAETVWPQPPDRILLEYATLIRQGKILDLGCGEGQNAVLFATPGYEVVGIDIAPSAVEKLLQQAQALSTPFHVEVGDVRETAIDPARYSLIISTMTLQFMKQSESERVFARIIQGLAPAGVVYVTVFSTDDPMYARLKRSTVEIEPNTFHVPSLGQHVHFFEKDELLSHFSDLKLIYSGQEIRYDLGHAGVPEPHYHGILGYMGQKSSD